MGDSFSPNAPLPTTPPLVSLEAFHVCDYFSCSVMSKPFSHGSAKGITWAGFALCVIVFISRISIRVVCFRRFFVEDYLMMLALTILLAITILGQLYVGYIYNFVTVSNGDQLPSPDFLSETSTGLRSFAALTVLNYVGIWLVKLNFLLFSAVLEKNVDKYRYFWWFAVCFNITAGATCIGLIDFKCVLPPAEVIFEKCNSHSSTTVSATASKVSASLDSVGDGLSESCEPPLRTIRN
ncbi:hypothetical protein CIB48_g6973 [Xylaria polymorpha]|nr:hypothetical protein CIB48_g6973 [Xylaria polymorpha]